MSDEEYCRRLHDLERAEWGQVHVLDSSAPAVSADEQKLREENERLNESIKNRYMAEAATLTARVERLEGALRAMATTEPWTSRVAAVDTCYKIAREALTPEPGEPKERQP